MVDESKPGAYVSDVGWCRKVTDCIKILCAWPHTVKGDLESRKLDSVSSKHKLVRVEYDAIVAAEVKPVDCLEKALCEVICPEEGVIDALSLVGDVGDDLVKSSRVSIA